jgi:hypothetical protein
MITVQIDACRQASDALIECFLHTQSNRRKRPHKLPDRIFKEQNAGNDARQGAVIIRVNETPSTPKYTKRFR